MQLRELREFRVDTIPIDIHKADPHSADKIKIFESPC